MTPPLEQEAYSTTLEPQASRSGASRRAVTLKDVARVADVHVSTASRALDPANSQRISDATVARVQAAAEQLGYMPDMIAKGLKRGTSMQVGVIVADLENPFIGPIIRGISNQVEKRELVTLVTETLEDHERLERSLSHLLSRQVNAVITTAARISDRPMLERFARSIPAFALAVRSLRGSSIPTVTQDDTRGGELAAEHLAELGHKVAAQLLGPTDIEAFVDRSVGFRRGAGARGLTEATVDDSATEVTLEEGRRLMMLALERNASNPPTAIFAHADVMAIGAMEVLAERGLLCPDDVSVVGYDDAPLVSHISPPLTSVVLPGEEIGRRAGEMVMAQLASPGDLPDSVRLSARLIPRASSGRPASVRMIARKVQGALGRP